METHGLGWADLKKHFGASATQGERPGQSNLAYDAPRVESHLCAEFQLSRSDGAGTYSKHTNILTHTLPNI